MSRRIWELDALRGLCILGMILVHLVYDIRELYGLADFAYPAIFSFVMQWGSSFGLAFSTAWGYACFCGRGWDGYPIGYWGLWPCSFWRWAIGSGALRWPPPGSFPWA